MAKKTSQFFEANEIMMITIMGGEFICNPDWKEIIPILCENVEYCRLVTNGDWAAKDPMATLDVLKPFKDVIKVSITKDHWHTNNHVEAAIEACKTAGLNYNVTNPKEDNDENIIPVGRGQYHYGMFAMFSCFCHDPEHKYTFLIDEEGDIFKCSPGLWNYTTVDECLTGGFAERFKKFNQAFYDGFVPNCKRCAIQWLSKNWRIQK